MDPLVALVLFGFFFVVALCLTAWAALTLGDRTRRPDEVQRGARQAGRPGSVAYVPLETAQAAKAQVWRSGTTPQGAARGSTTGTTAPRQDQAKPVLSNDDYRGARAVVTPRPTTEDAFERFFKSEADERR